MQYIKIHALDNVAVALADLAEGTEVSVDNQTVRLRQDVARGHKFALTDIAKGANVINMACRLVMHWRILRQVFTFTPTIRARI